MKARDDSDIANLSERIKLATTTVITSEDYKFTEDGFKSELEKQGYPVAEDGTITDKNIKYAITHDGAIRATIDELKNKESAVLINTRLEDVNGDIITIPMNFNISPESPTLISQGMIIEDNEDNQYVWIPVFKYDQNTCTWGANYSAVEGIEEGESEYYNKIESALKQYTSTYALSNYTDKWFGDSTTGRYGYYDKNDIEKKI